MEEMNKTIQYYNQNATEFFENTITADMNELQGRFLQYLSPNAVILDAGCGSGRDSKAFIEKGYNVAAIDASEQLCKLASAYIGQPVWKLSFEEMEYVAQFDGIWACASLLHVSKNELPEIMKNLHRALKENGILYASFKYGEGERAHGDRVFSDFTESAACNLFEAAGFHIEDCFVTSDVRPDRGEEHWVNVFGRKV